MFAYTTEPKFQYKEAKIKEVIPTHQRPDGVYWLYRPGRIDKLLKERSKNGANRLDDIIPSRPDGRGNANMAFPFLLFEAKSSTSADNIKDILRQSSLPIREMLKIQRGLFFNLDDRKYDVIRPHVWFICSQGHLWHVFGAYSHTGKMVRL